MVRTTLCASNQDHTYCLNRKNTTGGRTTQLPVRAKTLAINFDFLSDLHPVNHQVLCFEVYLLANFLSS